MKMDFSLDKTFCASKNCINKCGRKITKKQEEYAIKLNIPIYYAYFCENEIIIKEKENA